MCERVSLYSGLLWETFSLCAARLDLISKWQQQQNSKAAPQSGSWDTWQFHTEYKQWKAHIPDGSAEVQGMMSREHNKHFTRTHPSKHGSYDNSSTYWVSETPGGSSPSFLPVLREHQAPPVEDGVPLLFVQCAHV